MHYGTLVLGGKVRVPTLGGEEELKIPAGTDPEKVLVLEGKGLPGPSGRGDLKVKLKVAIPKRLGRRERELLSEFTAKLSPPDPPRRPAEL